MNYNYFPVGYQQYYPQTYPQTQQQNANSPIWVQGESAAKAWFVQPNSTVALWDSESQTIYLKSCDASGMPTMKILDYTLRDTTKPVERVSDVGVDYLTRDDLEAIYGQIRDLRDEIDNLSIRRAPKKKEADE